MNKERYFRWLVGKVGVRNHKRLLKELFNEEFRWDYALGSDENRAEDGIDLRYLYLSETNDETNGNMDVEEPCSVLEMLIALSLRIERDIMGDPGEDRPERWFWEMLENLGLLEETDLMFNEYYVQNTISCWMGRMYDRDGEGGIFPLKFASTDQRRVPIWDQMGEYLNENY